MGADKRYGCLMLQLNIPAWEKVVDIVDGADVWENSDLEALSGGVEDEPHTTILYGFHDEVNPEEVLDFVENLINKPIDLNFPSISHFANEKYDVVKVDVESEILTGVNKALTENFPYTTDHPEYHPHITISYVNSGSGSKYDRKLENWDKLELPSFTLKWSDANKNEIFRKVDVAPEKLPTLEQFLQNN